MPNTLKKLILSSAMVFSLAPAVTAIEKPTMGWSSWNTFAINISDSIIMRQADALIEKGLDKAGYLYINIDDGFFGGRDKAGHLLIHPTRFPNGLKPVADHIHDLGLKAGIYSDAGHKTCGSIWSGDTIAKDVGLYGHELEDCDLYFNDCDFDFIKVDYCGADGGMDGNLNYEPRDRYTAIRKAIDATRRPDVRLNICRWAFPGTWAKDIAVSWRVTGDIRAEWESVRSIIDESLYLAPYAGGGHYNDMDMLEVGRGMSDEEDHTHFAIWCIMSSPLMIGCDMSTLSDKSLALLKNEELIALNQDPLGLQAHVAKTDGNTYVFVKDIIEELGTQRAVAFYNPTDSEAEMSIDFADLQLGGNVEMRDASAKKSIGTHKGAYKVKVPAHGTRVYTLKAEKRLPQTKFEAENAYLHEYQELYHPESVGSAYVRRQPGTSGGAVVTNIGYRPANDLVWRQVIVPAEGDYDVTVALIPEGRCQLQISANEDPYIRFKFEEKSDPTTVTARLHLKKGINSIRLASTEKAPVIDCMTINL